MIKSSHASDVFRRTYAARLSEEEATLDRKQAVHTLRSYKLDSDSATTQKELEKLAKELHETHRSFKEYADARGLT